MRAVLRRPKLARAPRKTGGGASGLAWHGDRTIQTIVGLGWIGASGAHVDQRAFEVLKPLVEMPVKEIERPFVVILREEKIFPKPGRWMANYVVTVMSLLFEYAIDRGWMKTNPADGVKRVKKDKKRP